MEHKEKQVIFDNYAIENGRISFNDLINYSFEHGHEENLKNHIFNACDLVQQKQAERIAENAKIGSLGKGRSHEYIVDKESITNENNHIK